MASKADVWRALISVAPLYANYKLPAAPKDGEPDDREVVTNAWHLVVGHLEPDVLQQAMLTAATRTQFYPTPSLVLECAVELTTAPKRTGLDAWGDVKRAIAEHGFYHPPDGKQILSASTSEWTFEDVLVGKIVAALGWRELCLSENEMSDRARFCDAYEIEQRRAAESGRLPGAALALQGAKRQEALLLTAGVAARLSKGR